MSSSGQLLLPTANEISSSVMEGTGAPVAKGRSARRTRQGRRALRSAEEARRVSIVGWDWTAGSADRRSPGSTDSRSPRSTVRRRRGCGPRSAACVPGRGQLQDGQGQLLVAEGLGEVAPLPAGAGVEMLRHQAEAGRVVEA